MLLYDDVPSSYFQCFYDALIHPIILLSELWQPYLRIIRILKRNYVRTPISIVEIYYFLILRFSLFNFLHFLRDVGFFSFSLSFFFIVLLKLRIIYPIALILLTTITLYFSHVLLLFMRTKLSKLSLYFCHWSISLIFVIFSHIIFGL